MRVLHILSELRPSGFEVMLKVSAPYWRQLNIENEILATGDNLGQYTQTLEESGYPIYHIPFSRSPSFFISLYKFLRTHRYDALHVHVESANFWIVLVARLAGISRVVRTIHSVFPWGGWLGLKRRLQRVVLRSIGVMHVSISPSVKATEWDYFRNPTVCIPNWYDSERLIPLNSEVRNEIRAGLNIDGAFVLISVGNCSSCKNHAAILGALANIPDREKFLYLHVGEEESGHPERYLAEELGIAKQVRFLGFVEDVYPILNAADVYVMPSLHEGLGIAAVEAMGVGTPVILADVPGLKDLKEITDKIFWVNPEDDTLSEALLSMASLPAELRREMGLAMHKAVSKRFGIAQGVNAYAALYMGHEYKDQKYMGHEPEVGLKWDI